MNLTSNNAELNQHKNPWWRNILDFVLELVKVTAICASIIILVRWFLFQPFYVKGSSMEPNFFDGEYLIIYQLPYRFPQKFGKFQEEDRGRTLIFHPPNDPKEFYIKRLIGLPGERVEITDGRVKIYNDIYPNGFILDENYLPFEIKTLSGSYNDILLGVDQIYVLGDNRGYSLDSRRLGPVPMQNVIGEPVFCGWPLDKIGLLKKPEY
ncbi:MAG: signal peptidase I [Candidatus Jacksonbacteria bacterium]